MVLFPYDSHIFRESYAKMVGFRVLGCPVGSSDQRLGSVGYFTLIYPIYNVGYIHLLASYYLPWTSKSQTLDTVLKKNSAFPQRSKGGVNKISLRVGGFNPFEKNMSQNGNLAQVGVKIKNI